MPIYEDENTTREDLVELRRWNRCQVCRGVLNIFFDQENHKVFLACWDWPRTHHEGVEREAPSPFEPNIPTRREIMVEEHGEKKAIALDKYLGVLSLTRQQAMYILQTIWPEAPEVEVIKAAMICAQYGLNPLMRHIFLIPFKKHNKKGEVIGVDWAIVRGIGADRLLAQRRHHFSYTDLSPRRMTEDEQKKIRGEVDNSRIWAITKLKDMDTGAEAMGIGSWPTGEEPYGVEKGNTKLNMACIHSERQALDRQYPGEMPQGVDVIDEKYIEGDYTLIPEGDKTGGEKVGAPKPKSRATTEENPPDETIEGESFNIDIQWLEDSQKALKWSDDTMLSFLASSPYKVSGKNVIEALNKLTRELAEEFYKEINNKVGNQQPKLI